MGWRRDRGSAAVRVARVCPLRALVCLTRRAVPSRSRVASGVGQVLPVSGALPSVGVVAPAAPPVGARVRRSGRELVRLGRDCARCEGWCWAELQGLCRAEIGACRFCRAERVKGLGSLCDYHGAVVWDALMLWRRCNVRRGAL